MWIKCSPDSTEVLSKNDAALKFLNACNKFGSNKAETYINMSLVKIDSIVTCIVYSFRFEPEAEKEQEKTVMIKNRNGNAETAGGDRPLWNWKGG